jgi:hypothetical protein
VQVFRDSPEPRLDVIKVDNADGDLIFSNDAHGLDAVASGNKLVSAIALDDGRRRLQPQPTN